MQSEPFATDLLAAMGGIAHAEMLMANQQWAASECEALAERVAAFAAETLARDIQWAAKWARELAREDVAIAVETGQMPHKEVWPLLRELEQLVRQSTNPTGGAHD